MDYWVSTLIGYSMYSERTLKGCLLNGILYGDTTLTGIDDEENPIASEFKLEQNYPNPFNPSTVISYQLPVTSNVTLKVYDVLGNEIATLVNEELPAGEYEVEFDPSSIKHLPSSGIYFYQLKAGQFSETKKMILLK
ncbi:MAG: T9SS type A sorting domain-containing protein [bacterium]|nr:T9SS type A sorting domain-containing protein [bacterium]